MGRACDGRSGSVVEQWGRSLARRGSAAPGSCGDPFDCRSLCDCTSDLNPVAECSVSKAKRSSNHAALRPRRTRTRSGAPVAVTSALTLYAPPNALDHRLYHAGSELMSWAPFPPRSLLPVSASAPLLRSRSQPRVGLLLTQLGHCCTEHRLYSAQARNLRSGCPARGRAITA